MTKESFMQEEIAKEIVILLMDERKMNLHDALRTLYTSETYAKLLNINTGLYSQSTAYVYGILEKELVTGKIS